MISELSSAFLRSVLVFLFTLHTFLSQFLCGLLQPEEESNRTQSTPQAGNLVCCSFLPIMLERVLFTGAYPKCTWSDALLSSRVWPHPHFPILCPPPNSPCPGRQIRKIKDYLTCPVQPQVMPKPPAPCLIGPAA